MKANTQARYDALEKAIRQVFADEALPDEQLQAWSFTQGLPAIYGRPLFGGAIAFSIRPYIMAVTSKRVFLVQLKSTRTYQVAKIMTYPLDKVTVVKIKKHLIVRWASMAYVTTPDNSHRFDYFPSRTWAQLDPVLTYIKLHGRQ